MTWHAVLRDIPPGQVVLLDCATLWLTNHLLADADIAAKSAELLTALHDCASPVVVVSNEVGWGIVPDNALARAFRDHQGRLNQQIAAQADLVVGVMAGSALRPEGHSSQSVMPQRTNHNFAPPAQSPSAARKRRLP